MIDIYCERQGPGLFAEPVNTATNVVFILAAFFAWLLARRHRAVTPSVVVLLFLAVSVGLGSALWHMFAAPWAKWADLIPILLFQLWFVWLYLRGSLGISAMASLVWLIVYAVLCVLMTRVPPYFNGSILYAPTLAGLIGLGWVHYARNEPGRWLLIIASLLFCLALVFRSIDELVCRHVPFGTHFLWHLLTGGLVFVAMQAIILQQSRKSVPETSSPIRIGTKTWQTKK